MPQYENLYSKREKIVEKKPVQSAPQQNSQQVLLNIDDVFDALHKLKLAQSATLEYIGVLAISTICAKLDTTEKITECITIVSNYIGEINSINIVEHN